MILQKDANATGNLTDCSFVLEPQVIVSTKDDDKVARTDHENISNLSDSPSENRIQTEECYNKTVYCYYNFNLSRLNRFFVQLQFLFKFRQ